MENRPPYQRFTNAFVLPDLDHGYVTVPQPGLGGRSIPYQRGKGLGGTSMLNFLIWTRGSGADWNRWAELVGDDEWNWKKIKQRYLKVR
jgi:choline dehydrogenase-like flavoprotein